MLTLGLECGVTGEPSFDGEHAKPELSPVDPGRRGCGRQGLVGAGFAVSMPSDLVGDGLAHVTALVAHRDVAQVEGVEEQLDPPPGQRGVDLVGVAVQGECGGLGHGALLGPQERLVQLRRGGCHRPGPAGGHDRLPGAVPPVQRRLPGLGVHPGVVDGLDPGGEVLIQFLHGVQLPAGADLDEELLTHGTKHPLDLPSSLRAPWGGVDQADPQACQGAQELPINERGSVVHVCD